MKRIGLAMATRWRARPLFLTATSAALLGRCLLLCSHADVLTLRTGERLIGNVLTENPATIVFHSQGLGRIEVPRGQIERIVRELNAASLAGAAPRVLPPPQAPTETPSTSLVPIPASGLTTNSSQAATLPRPSWFPPLPPKDRHDWIQLKSGEWLKGELIAMQKRKLQFDSDELDDVAFDWKDIRQLRLPKALIAYGDHQTASGALHVEGDVATVTGDQVWRIPRADLEAITPGEPQESNYWSGKLDVGLDLQAGNTEQAALSSRFRIERRTPKTHLRLNYTANYGELEGIENLNNQHGTLFGDWFLTRRWFVRPLYGDYYRDPFQNIAHRGTVGAGAGYYLVDSPSVEWLIVAGPGYQSTWFGTVEPGQPSQDSTPAAFLSSQVKWEITKRIDLEIAYQSTFVGRDSGGVLHHSVSTLEIELTRQLDLDLSFTWDRISLPQPEANGTLPKPDDFRLNLTLGFKF